MMPETVESLSTVEFANAIKQYIGWAAAWDGALPADVFFGVWADLQQQKKPLELKARIVQGQLKFVTPTVGSIKVVDNAIYLEDGRELIIHLEAAT
jgi:hypothetical protein